MCCVLKSAVQQSKRAAITPTDATDKTVTWTSSAPTIASVTTAGLKSGTATITAKTSNGKSATCAVTVTPIVKTPTNLTASDVTDMGKRSVMLRWLIKSIKGPLLLIRSLVQIQLSPATSYIFTVTESDGADESAKSNQVTVTTNGRLTIPTTKEVVNVMYCVDALGIETNGLGTGSSFGGTVPVSVPVIKNTISGTSRVLEVASGYHMGDQTAVLVESNKYLIIYGNKRAIGVRKWH